MKTNPFFTVIHLSAETLKQDIILVSLKKKSG